MCRKWSGRQVFSAAGPVLPVLPVLRHAVGHVLVRRRTSTRAASAGSRSPWVSPYEHSRWFRGRDTALRRMRPGCPDGDCCQRPPAEPGRPLGGHGLAVGPGALAHPVRAARPASSPAWTRPTSTSSWTATTSELMHRDPGRGAGPVGLEALLSSNIGAATRQTPRSSMSSAPDTPLPVHPGARAWTCATCGAGCTGSPHDVIRPAAAEWDEREETPWPILEEAAKIGLYSLDFFGQQWLEPSGPGHPDRVRGAVLGRRGHRAVPGRQLAGRGRGGQQRHQRADRRVAAADVRRAR